VNNAGWATFGEVEWVGMATYRHNTHAHNYIKQYKST
jgi:hypothetical protein